MTRIPFDPREPERNRLERAVRQAAPRASDIMPRPGRPSRPEVVTKDDFVSLCELAYRRVHTRSLASQMAETLNLNNDKSAQRWLDSDGPPAPLGIIEDAYKRADHAMAEKNDMLDRIAAVLPKAATLDNE